MTPTRPSHRSRPHEAELTAKLRAAEAEVARLKVENARLYGKFHGALTSIGGILYTQGTGAKWQMDLLARVRDERERLEQEYVK